MYGLIVTSRIDDNKDDEMNAQVTERGFEQQDTI
jgi:hypothetical protein